MRKIELTMNEQTKYEMVKQFVDNGERNIKRLSIKLNCSLKTAYNYVAKYKANGKEAFSHGNHKHKPTTTIDESISNKIIEIYTMISADTNVNFRHFRLILERFYKLFTTTLRAGLCFPKRLTNTLKSSLNSLEVWFTWAK